MNKKRKFVYNDGDIRIELNHSLLTRKGQAKRLKRQYKQLCLEEIKELGNALLWINILGPDIGTKILDYLQLDIYWLLNVGLVCKLWYYGIPNRVWYKSQVKGKGNNFCIMEYMRRAFKPNVLTKSIIKESDVFSRKVVQFAGLKGNGMSWYYDKKKDLYTLIGKTKSRIMFRALEDIQCSNIYNGNHEFICRNTIYKVKQYRIIDVPIKPILQNNKTTNYCEFYVSFISTSKQTEQLKIRINILNKDEAYLIRKRIKNKPKINII